MNAVRPMIVVVVASEIVGCDVPVLSLERGNIGMDGYTFVPKND
jgi:hypothetical protein